MDAVLRRTQRTSIEGLDEARLIREKMRSGALNKSTLVFAAFAGNKTALGLIGNREVGNIFMVDSRESTWKGISANKIIWMICHLSSYVVTHETHREFLTSYDLDRIRKSITASINLMLEPRGKMAPKWRKSAKTKRGHWLTIATSQTIVTNAIREPAPWLNRPKNFLAREVALTFITDILSAFSLVKATHLLMCHSATIIQCCKMLLKSHELSCALDHCAFSWQSCIDFSNSKCEMSDVLSTFKVLEAQ